jgi:rhomboid protease GluP
MASLNDILSWMVGPICVMLLALYFRRFSLRALKTGWVIVLCMNLAVLVLGWLWFPSINGIITAIFFVLFIFSPMILLQFTLRCFASNDFAKAKKFAEILKFLHPADGMADYALFIHAIGLQHQGKFEDSEQLLGKLSHSGGYIGPSARTELLKLRANWEEIFEKYRTHPDLSLCKDYHDYCLYLQAAGEVGALTELFKAFDASESDLKKLLIAERALVRLIVYAFAGKTEAVKHLFSGPLRFTPPDQQTFWLATAELAAGKHEAGNALLVALKAEQNPAFSKVLLRRETYSLPIASQILSPETMAILENDIKHFENETRFQSYLKPLTTSKVRPKVTYTFMLIYLLVFVVDYLVGGATQQHPSRLTMIGALVPAYVLDGEGWRLVTAPFLQSSGLELSATLFILWMWGSFLEFRLGRIRYVAFYLFSGILNGSILTLLAHQGFISMTWHLGVSPFLAILGAMLVILFQARLREKNPLAGHMFVYLVVIVLLIILQTNQHLAISPPLLIFISGVLSGALITTSLLLTEKK